MRGRGAGRQVEELTTELMALRQALSTPPGREATKRYKEELGFRALSYMRRRREGGGKMPEIARELGVTENRLYRWQAQANQGMFREVRVVSERQTDVAGRAVVMAQTGREQGEFTAASTPCAGQTGGLVLVSPGGYELRGLDLESALLLLRRL